MKWIISYYFLNLKNKTNYTYIITEEEEEDAKEALSKKKANNYKYIIINEAKRIKERREEFKTKTRYSKTHNWKEGKRVI